MAEDTVNTARSVAGLQKESVLLIISPFMVMNIHPIGKPNTLYGTDIEKIETYLVKVIHQLVKSFLFQKSNNMVNSK